MSIREFIRDHKTLVIVGTGVVAGGALFTGGIALGGAVAGKAALPLVAAKIKVIAVGAATKTASAMGTYGPHFAKGTAHGAGIYFGKSVLATRVAGWMGRGNKDDHGGSEAGSDLT